MMASACTSRPRGRLICPYCTKPNVFSEVLTYCTCCNGSLENAAVEEFKGCPFCGIASSETADPTERILFKSSKFIVFEAKHKVALVQLNICPIDHIESILDVDYRSKRENEPIGVGKITSQDVEEMYNIGLKFVREETETRGLGFSENDAYSGFNSPPSVPHLHLVMFMYPFAGQGMMGYPRWWFYEDVLQWWEDARGGINSACQDSGDHPKLPVGEEREVSSSAVRYLSKAWHEEKVKKCRLTSVTAVEQ